MEVFENRKETFGFILKEGEGMMKKDDDGCYEEECFQRVSRLDSLRSPVFGLSNEEVRILLLKAGVIKTQFDRGPGSVSLGYQEKDEKILEGESREAISVHSGKRSFMVFSHDTFSCKLPEKLCTVYRAK